MFKAMFHVGVAVVLLCAAFVCNFEIASAQIAPGVLQSAAHTATLTGTVTQSDGTPVAGANVQLSGPAILSTKSDAHGTFVLTSVPWGTYQIVVISALGTVSKTNVTVNGDITVAIQYQVSAQAGLKTIAHVSTRSAGASINVTSSAIASISPSDYAFQGNGTWKGLFAQIPGVAASGYSGFGNSSAQAIPGSPMAPVVLSLNGALPYETATLLDGMPLQGTSCTEGYFSIGGGVDLSNMPVNAFDTADVVRGPGANAPSIVDSIGGSFVLHAPGQVDANHFEFSASNDPYGGIVSNAKVALHLGRLSATFIYGVNDSPGPLGTSKVISASTYLGPGDTINGQPVQSYTTFTGPSTIPNCYACSVGTTLLVCCTPQSTAWTQHTGAAALSYKFTSSITAEVFYAGSTSHQNYQFGYSPTEFSPLAAAPAYNGSFSASPPGHANYTFLGSPEPILNNQSSSLLEEKVTAYIGHGVLRLAALQNNTFFGENYNTAALSSGTYTMWGTACVGAAAPNAACPSGGTSTAYNGTTENVAIPNPCSIDYQAWSNNRDILGSYAVQVGSASSVGVSYVTSYYNDPLIFNLTPLFSLGQPSAFSETTNETRLHVDTEVGDKLSLALSWYFANATYHLSNSPGMWTSTTFPYSAPRFGVVWQASHDIAIRASAGGGYALPAFYSLVGTPPTFTGSGYYDTLANPNIKPEESFGWDVGTDIRFHRTTVLSLDLYRTNLYGQFFTGDSFSTFNGLPLQSTQFGNIATSLMEGINLDVHHDVPSGYYWRGTLGLTRGYVVSVPPGFYNNPSVPCTNCVNTNVIPGPNFDTGAFTSTVPYASGSLQVGYKWNPGKYVDLSSTYYGSNNIYNVPAFVELDAHAGYALTKNVSLLATFRNITGIYDQSVQIYTPGYAVPVIPGAAPYYPGAVFQMPYGPRSVVVTLNFKQ